LNAGATGLLSPQSFKPLLGYRSLRVLIDLIGVQKNIAIDEH
jgi:hypothetical protein